MIVLAIIGVLAAAFFPALSGYLARWRDSTRVTEIKQINSALVLYQVANRTYKVSEIGPGSWQWWVNTLETGNFMSTVKALESKWFLKNGIQDITASERTKSPVTQNTTPCGNSSDSQDLYILNFSDAAGKYSISGYMENQLKANMDNVILSYNALWATGSCSTYGRNYSVWIN